MLLTYRYIFKFHMNICYVRYFELICLSLLSPFS